MRKKSPFICGGPVPPTYFIGREEQTDALMGQLTGPARGGSAIYGERRVGKTSLLHYLMSDQVAEEWGVPTESWHFVLLDCQQIDKPGQFWPHVFKYIADIDLGEELDAQARSLSKNKMVEEAALARFFDRVARQKRFIVLLLDEFECITEQLDPKNPEVLYQLRQLLNRQQRGLAIVTASRESVDLLCRDIDFKGSPFYNNLLSVQLPSFMDSEIKDLLALADPPFSESEAAYIARIGGRHPLLLQLAADATHRHRARLKAGRPLDFAAIGRAYERRARQHYRDLWRDTHPKDQILLALVALRSFHQREGGRGYEVQAIETLLTRSGRALRTLAERGFVTDDVFPRLLSSVGEWWLIEEIAGWAEIAEEWKSFLLPSELSQLEAAIRAARVNQRGLRNLASWAVRPESK